MAMRLIHFTTDLTGDYPLCFPGRHPAKHRYPASDPAAAPAKQTAPPPERRQGRKQGGQSGRKDLSNRGVSSLTRIRGLKTRFAPCPRFHTSDELLSGVARPKDTSDEEITTTRRRSVRPEAFSGRSSLQRRRGQLAATRCGGSPVGNGGRQRPESPGCGLRRRPRVQTRS